MERFAFKIDKAVKANLYKICRLCGIDNPEKVPILAAADKKDDTINVDCEPDLRQKISELIGLTVSKDDRMPQTMCMLCVDKINDFYEFREMCFATNAQTRKLLGVKKEISKRPQQIDIKPCVITVKEDPNAGPTKRGRKRKSEDIVIDTKAELNLDTVKKEDLLSSSLPPIRKKQRLGAKTQMKSKNDIKNELSDATDTTIATIMSNNKLRQTCSICHERFLNKANLEQHKSSVHVPRVPRFFCIACNDTLQKSNDIKDHQLWHKLTKTAYKCGLCDQLLTSIYAYTRHLREHAPIIPTTLLVLDRECPQCKKTFITNYLYNTHKCALRTKKCGGCNRQQRNDAEYLRHAPTCAKIYLNHSKHILGEALATESLVRIKNENDVEAAAAADLGVDMMPTVSLTRLPTPVLRDIESGSHSVGNEALQSATTSSKKVSKKGGSKHNFKRVDELLKSTMDALVSIKHEPEVHVETDECVSNNAEDCVMDNFHFAENNSDDDHDMNEHLPEDVSINNLLSVKQEVFDDFSKNEQQHDSSKKEQQTDNVTEADDVHIKQEMMDTDDTSLAMKMPVLKLKITKEHGQLNSSLVDAQQLQHERKKHKKKKRKEAEKCRNKGLDTNVNDEENSIMNQTQMQQTSPKSTLAVNIKEEHFAEDDEVADEYNMNNSTQFVSQPEATAMTYIPMMQFQISCVSSGVDFKEPSDHQQNISMSGKEILETERDAQQDIKPNRWELDRLMQITNVSSGVDIAEEAAEETQLATTVQQISSATNAIEKNPIKKSNIKRKAMKSTAAVSRSTARKSTAIGDLPPMMPFNSFVIKTEPCDRGYADEAIIPELSPQHIDQINIENLSSHDADAAYIKTIDFNNISIKQEKDIDVSDVQLTAFELPLSTVFNGVGQNSNAAEENADDDFYDDDSISSADEAEEAEEEDSNDNETEEIREYREIEMPPLLETDDVALLPPMADSAAPSFVITNVCSQIDKEKNNDSSIPISLEISNVASGYTEQPLNVTKTEEDTALHLKIAANEKLESNKIDTNKDIIKNDVIVTSEILSSNDKLMAISEENIEIGSSEKLGINEDVSMDADIDRNEDIVKKHEIATNREVVANDELMSKSEVDAEIASKGNITIKEDITANVDKPTNEEIALNKEIVMSVISTTDEELVAIDESNTKSEEDVEMSAYKEVVTIEKSNELTTTNDDIITNEEITTNKDIVKKDIVVTNEELTANDDGLMTRSVEDTEIVVSNKIASNENLTIEDRIVSADIETNNDIVKIRDTIATSTELATSDELLQNMSAISEETTTYRNNETEEASNEETFEATKIISGTVIEDKDVSLEAEPFHCAGMTATTSGDVNISSVNSDNDDSVATDSEEEQQNALNHAISTENETRTNCRFENILSINEAASNDVCNSSSSTNIAEQNEETENRINEIQQAQQQEQQNQLFPDDDTNINEIAENNNNANIERELQDDSHSEARLELEDAQEERNDI